MFSVNLPRASSLYGSTSNLSSTRAFRGSNPNLASQPGTTHLNTFSSAMTGFQNVSKSNQKNLRYGEVKLLLLVHELGAEQTETEAGHCKESGEDGNDRDGGQRNADIGVMGMSTMELGDGDDEDRGCEGNRMRIFLSD